MTDVKNCKRCGRVFNYLGGYQLCPMCKKQDEDDFKRVKDYLYENPGATISHIAGELSISVEKIKRFLREGRLEIAEGDANLFLECEMCGKAIKTGRFCVECERTLAKDLNTAANQITRKASVQEETKSPGLRYLYKETDNHAKKDKR